MRWSVALVVLCAAPAASADEFDFGRFKVPANGGASFAPDAEAWRDFFDDLVPVVAQSVIQAPIGREPGSLSIALEGAFSGISEDAPQWRAKKGVAKDPFAVALDLRYTLPIGFRLGGGLRSIPSLGLNVPSFGVGWTFAIDTPFVPTASLGIRGIGLLGTRGFRSAGFTIDLEVGEYFAVTDDIGIGLFLGAHVMYLRFDGSIADPTPTDLADVENNFVQEAVAPVIPTFGGGAYLRLWLVTALVSSGSSVGGIWNAALSVSVDI